jgi:FMN-dependent NADH-azoreductase
MAHILHLDSSPRGNRSISRTLTKEFITDWKASNPNDIVTYRDLGHYPVPAVDEAWIAASFAPAESRTTELAAVIKTSDELIDEFLAADYYVFGVPMFNFSIPSTLKAYIDQILRVNRTFVINNDGYEGLAKNKKMLIITARGGTYQPGTPSAEYDFQEPYLRTAFGFIGITDITFIHADNLAAGDEVRQQSLTAARAAIEKMVASW